MERRTVLAAGGAIAVGTVVAACGSGEQASQAGESTPSFEVATTGQVPVEGGYVNADAAIVVTQPQAGAYKAFTAVCPHQGCLVSEVVANEIVCPCHGSRFSAVDGAVLMGPATEGLAAAPVAVAGDRILA